MPLVPAAIAAAIPASVTKELAIVYSLSSKEEVIGFNRVSGDY
jgi:hypothetical protein